MKKIELNKETIRSLGSKDLSKVAGGRTLWTCTALDNCTSTVRPCNGTSTTGCCP